MIRCIVHAAASAVALLTLAGNTAALAQTPAGFELAPIDVDGGKTVLGVALPIKGFAQAEYRRQFDLMPGGRQFLVLLPMSGR